MNKIAIEGKMNETQVNYLPDGFPSLFDPEAKTGYDDYFLWDDILLRESIHPELAQKTLSLIQKRLGYVPTQSIAIHYEPDLRLYYHSYLFGDIDRAGLYYRTDELLKLMRKWDLKPDNKLFDTPEVFKQFSENYLPYLQQAYARISHHLGYEPNPQCSMAAEIWLGQIIAKDTIQLTDAITPYDYRCMTSIKYREILLAEGEKMANESPLLAMHEID